MAWLRGHPEEAKAIVAGACFGATKTDAMCFSVEEARTSRKGSEVGGGGGDRARLRERNVVLWCSGFRTRIQGHRRAQSLTVKHSL
jgi:hypothetical protein